MKKAITLFLALVMCLSLLTFTAFAAENKEYTEGEVNLADIKVGDTIKNGVIVKCADEDDNIVYFCCSLAKHVYPTELAITIENQPEIASASGLWLVVEAGEDNHGHNFISLKQTGNGVVTGSKKQSSVPATPLTPATPTHPACPLTPAIRKGCCIIKVIGCLAKQLEDCDLCDKLKDCAEKRCEAIEQCKKDACEQLMECAKKRCEAKQELCDQLKLCAEARCKQIALCKQEVCEQMKACAKARCEAKQELCEQVKECAAKREACRKAACEKFEAQQEKFAECQKAACEQFWSCTGNALEQVKECNEAFLGGVCKTIKGIADFNECIISSIFGCCR